MFSFVQSAVQENRLADVDIRGFKLGNDRYRDVSEAGVLIGFQLGLGTFATTPVLNAWRPIYSKQARSSANGTGRLPRLQPR